MRFCTGIPEEHEEQIAGIAATVYPDWARWVNTFGEESAFANFSGIYLAKASLSTERSYTDCLAMHLFLEEERVTEETEARLAGLAKELKAGPHPQPGARDYFEILENAVAETFSDLPLTRRRVFHFANQLSDLYIFGWRRSKQES